MIKTGLVLLVTALSLTGCFSTGNGSGANGYTHNELAGTFVDELNLVSGYSVQLAKASTQQYNYVVILDNNTGEFYAINVVGWVPGGDPVAYLNSSNSDLRHDLYHYTTTTWDSDNNPTTKHYYRDEATGMVFEKCTASKKDLEKVGALAEAAVVSRKAEALSERFGLSVERSTQVVRLGMAWNRRGGRNLSEKDQDAFAKEALGFTITEAQSALKKSFEGNTSSLDQILDKAARTNGISAEHAREIMTDLLK